MYFGDKVKPCFLRFRSDESCGFWGEVILSDGCGDGFAYQCIVGFGGGFLAGLVGAAIRELSAGLLQVQIFPPHYYLASLVCWLDDQVCPVAECLKGILFRGGQVGVFQGRESQSANVFGALLDVIIQCSRLSRVGGPGRGRTRKGG